MNEYRFSIFKRPNLRDFINDFASIEVTDKPFEVIFQAEGFSNLYTVARVSSAELDDCSSFLDKNGMRKVRSVIVTDEKFIIKCY